MIKNVDKRQVAESTDESESANESDVFTGDCDKFVKLGNYFAQTGTSGRIAKTEGASTIPRTRSPPHHIEDESYAPHLARQSIICFEKSGINTTGTGTAGEQGIINTAENTVSVCKKESFGTRHITKGRRDVGDGGDISCNYGSNSNSTSELHRGSSKFDDQSQDIFNEDHFFIGVHDKSSIGSTSATIGQPCKTITRDISKQSDNEQF